MKLDFYSDPSHGWLKVPMKTFIKYSTLETRLNISRFSYMTTTAVFLEEDMDAGFFIKDLENKKIPFTFKEHMSNKMSRIRSYESYSTVFRSNMPATIL